MTDKKIKTPTVLSAESRPGRVYFLSIALDKKPNLEIFFSYLKNLAIIICTLEITSLGLVHKYKVYAI